MPARPSTTPPGGDSVDAVLAEWERERPDLDMSPVGVVTRLGKLRTLLDQGLQHVFDRYDLTAADFGVIVALRRSGPPFRRAQAQLAERMSLTSGTVSVRIDRLVARGVVVREPDPGDRRSQQVRLTEQGLTLFDEIAPVHLANEDRLLSALSAAERDQLVRLLRPLLASLERPVVRIASLGLELLESPLARERRAAVGLSEPPGLLVAAPPAADSPAARAGLLQGDLITSVDRLELHSCVALAGQLRRPRRHRRLTVGFLRGEQAGEAMVLLPPRRTAARTRG